MAEFKIHNQEGVSYVEVILQNETVRTESGAMRYMLGNLQMESKGPGLGGFLKAALSSESVYKPTYTGTGKLVLEPTMTGFFELDLNGEGYVLDRGAYWASENSVQVEARVNKSAAGLVGGEGLIQTLVQGTGKVIVQTPGPVEVLELTNDRLVVDGTFAVARSAALNFSVQKSTKSLMGSMTSGEGLVSVIEGTGRVYLAPIPNKYVMLQSVMVGVHSSSAR